MADPRASWDEVGSKFSSLGLKLKMHFEQARGEAEEGEEGEQELRAAVRKLADALEDAISAVGEAAKDPAVKADVKDVGRSLTDAISVTFAEVSEDVRAAFKKRS